MTAEAIERTKATRFQVGGRVWNHRPVGWERVNVYGYIEVKIAEPRTFKLKHRHAWEQAHGPIPKGHNVVFRDGDTMNCKPENLELVSNAENMKRNTLHRFPEEVRQLIHAKGALTRQINNKLKNN
jgi:hypothetical protein